MYSPARRSARARVVRSTGSHSNASTPAQKNAPNLQHERDASEVINDGYLEHDSSSEYEPVRKSKRQRKSTAGHLQKVARGQHGDVEGTSDPNPGHEFSSSSPDSAARDHHVDDEPRASEIRDFDNIRFTPFINQPDDHIMDRNDAPVRNWSVENDDTDASQHEQSRAGDDADVGDFESQDPARQPEANNDYAFKAAQLQYRRTELAELLTSHLGPESHTNADYSRLVELVNLLCGDDKIILKETFKRDYASRIESITVWLKILESFSTFRMNSQFSGNKEDWMPHCEAIQSKADRLLAWNAMATLKRRMLEIKMNRPHLNLNSFSSELAPVLIQLTGSASYIRAEHLAECLVDFLSKLFDWLG